MARDTMIRIAPLLVAVCLTACGQAKEQTASSTQSLVAETPQGKTYDNPFGGNATAASEPAATVADNVTDPVAAPMASDPVDDATPAPATVAPGEPEPRMSRPTGSSCDDGKRVCGDMTSCEDARFHLQQCGMRRLDGDGDGTPCEKICG